MKKTIFLLSLLGLYFISAIAFSQGMREKDRSRYYDIGKKFYCETHILPYKTDSVKILILFKIGYDQLSFQKINSADISRGEFAADADFEFEFRDADGIICHRDVWEDTIFVSNYDMIKSDTNFVIGGIISILKSGPYDLHFRMAGPNMQNSQKKTLPKIEDVNFFTNYTISKPIFVNYYDFEKFQKAKPFILENGISFRSSGASLIIPVSYKSEYEKYSYKIKYLGQKKTVVYWEKTDDLYGKIIPQPNAFVDLILPNQKNNPLLSINNIILPKDTAIKFKIGLLKLDIPQEKIAPGIYELTLSRDGSKDTLKEQFEVVWEDMPLSLYNPDYAADMMYYILTDDECDALKKGSQKEIMQKIINYWQKHDPTPNTPYNEAMAEYFRRIDYAFFNFQTVNQNDGAKTDRGKIYILNGPPDSRDTNLGTDKTTETWKYIKLKKIYIFETAKTDNLILVKVNDIK
ncbi:MAG: GWxTD domain-containing protein [FCB group bacterium]|jgi:GWxTD domain-containing protein